MRTETFSGSIVGGMDYLPAHNWSWFALRGVLAIALGLAALLLPGPAMFAFATVFAAFAFVDGVLALISGIRGAREHEERWGALIVAGLLGIVVGVAFFFFPVLGTVAYTFTAGLVIAAWAVIIGILEIAAAIRLRRVIRGEWLLMLAGALAIIFGVALLVLLTSAPALTLLSVAWLLGIYALATGISLLLLAFRLKSHDAAILRH